MAFTERRAAPQIRSWTGVERRIARGERGTEGIAEMIDPTAEQAYWAENYRREPYYERGYTYADYHPGYRTGWEARARHEGRSYDDVERELEAEYNRNRGSSRLGWEKNRHAARAAWQRFDT